MVNHAHYTENEEKIKNTILSIERAYNPSDQFVVTMETFIKTQYEAADAESVTIDKSSDQILFAAVEKSLTDKEKAAIERRMKTEISNINVKYAKYRKNLSTCPDYLTEWRDFYLTYSARLASCGVLDKKFYNYIGLFHKHFRKQLDTKKQNEIERRREEVEAALSQKKDLEKDSSSDDECEVKIIEEVHETYSVSSNDDDDEIDEPAAKKQKVGTRFWLLSLN